MRVRLGRSASEEDVEDAYQDAWVRLLERCRGGEELDDLDAWLIRVAERCAIDEYRRPRRRRNVPLEALDGISGSDPVEAAHERWNRQLVLDCLRRHFDPTELRILMLTYGAGCPRAQVAEQMRVSPKRLHKLLDGHKGKAGLRRRAETYLRALADGRLCQTYASVTAAWRLGWFGPDTQADRAVRAHLRTCPSCRAYLVKTGQPACPRAA